MTVLPDPVAPPSALNLKGDIVDKGIRLHWENPGILIPYEVMIAGFEGGSDGFTGETIGTADPGGSLERVNNDSVSFLRIHYQITKTGGQVGKTFIINEFGKNQFEHYLCVNLEQDRNLQTVFARNNPEIIINELTSLYNVPVIAGKTLLFIDEIQVSPASNAKKKNAGMLNCQPNSIIKNQSIPRIQNIGQSDHFLTGDIRYVKTHQTN